MTIDTLDPWKSSPEPAGPEDGVFVFPASYAQQRLWFLDQLAPGSPVYNLPFAWRLRGRLESKALASAVAEIVERHEALRTTFTVDDREPVQVVSPPGGAADLLPIVDLSFLSADQREAEARLRVEEEARLPFDLERGPLFRAGLLRLDAEDHVFFVTFHHIVSDGWSLAVFQNELSSLYGLIVSERPALLPELPIQYADFALWQRDFLRGQLLENQIAWWKAALDGAPPVLELPFRPRPAVSAQRGAWRRVEVPRRLGDALREVGQSEGATRFMTFLAAFEVLLHQCTGQEDLVVGTPVSGRTQVETEGLIGLFVNTLALRTDLSGVSTFRELLARVKESALGAYSHQELPFERLVEELQPERSLAHNPLVQVTFSLQERARDRGLELAGLCVQPWDSGDRGESTAKFDLALFVEEAAAGVRLRLDWDAELLEEAEALRLLESYEVLLEGIAADPWRPLWSLPVLPAASRHQLIAEWNDTAERLDVAAPLHERFAAQAARTPDAVALVHQEARLTYAELDRRTNRLARRLRALGAGPESRVGVALERTPDLIAALLAVQKAGGAYVPLDPAYPSERLALILEDAPLLVTSASLLDRMPAFRGRTVLLDTGEMEKEEDGPLPSLAGPRNLAYLIYTSGSTGRPKGVAIEHRSAAALLEWAAEIFPAEATAVVLASTSITFDLSVFEIFLPLTRGGTVVLAENALALPELPSRESVTLINTVPSAIAALVRTESLPASVRTVNLAGEPLKRALVNDLYAVPTVEAVYNLYGPSEDTTYSTWERVPREEEREPTIGAPIANTRGYVLDRWLRPLPAGVPGELFLAGAGLARGYLNRPDLTAASFVPDPFGSRGDRLYRTGDLARRLPDGRLDFLGRIDHQVKVRGYRIELGEIESHLLAHPDVRDAVVLALGEGEARSLAAFVVGGGELRSWLETRLPAHMIPSSFVHLDALPLSPNGKVDRKALPKLVPEREARPDVAAVPRTAAEELLAGIWADVLRVAAVGLHDSFFDLGGHSLLATQVVSRAREVFRVELPLRALFETPTIAGLAARLESVRRVPAPPIARVPREGDLQASFAQERLWFLDRFGTDRASYNLPSAIHLRGKLDTAALAGALSEIVRRHESLRTTFRVTGGTEPRVLQVIGPAGSGELPVVDLSGVSDRRGEAARLQRDEARRTFDLSRGPLLRRMLVRTEEQEHTLLLTPHHIVSDGWSIGVMLRELKALYSAAILPELPIQYADFAAWQRDWLQGEALARQLGWWRDHLTGAPAVLELPADRPRQAVQSGRGGRFSMKLPRVQEAVHLFARQQGATPFMVLLAAFQALVGRLANRDDVPVGTPIAGRNRAEVEGLIGFFVNTLILRADLAGDPSFRQLLGRSRDTILSAYDHQDLPFEKLVEELQPERSLAHTPLFQVMFILQNAPLDALELPGLSVVAEAPDTATTKFDLSLSLMETSGGLIGSVVYARDLFDETTARRLAASFERLLAAALADPAAPLVHLPLLSEAEEQHLLREWNDTEVNWDLDRPLHRWIEAQVLRTPDAPALTFEGETLTYRELDARAGRLAGRLRRLGVGPESRVGVASERSLELVVGLLGVLKAGGAYVPLDPSYPQERLDFMIADLETGADNPVLLTQKLLKVDGEESASAVEVLPDHPAYVIYTSGSTGRPKGAVNTHRAIVNRLVWMQEQYGLTSEDVVLQKTPYSFDVSVWEFFWPLMVGARLVVARPGGHQDSAYLAELIRREGVTTLHFVPSMLQVFLEQPGVETCVSIRRVICSGEALPFELQQRFFARLGGFAELHNLYGPTEAAVDVTVWACEPGRARPIVPIGRPISNLHIHVLDRGSNPAPVGVPGELHIGGVGLARGYLNRPDMTAERFVPDPFGEPGSRLYRTGDLVRLLPAGEVEYLGRLDFQVKIRGFRIELGEIEAALAAHPSVKEAVVLAREDRPGDKRLVAYMTGTEPHVPELRRHLSTSLPEYMVPSSFVVLPALPLSPNGKVDRKALPAPEVIAPADRESVAPRTPLEEHLAELWKAPLGLDRIGIHDDFFALGGNSISGAVLINRLQEELGEIVHVVAIFDAPTVERMARHLSENHAAAVERIWGRESLGTGAAQRASGRVDAGKVAQIRALIEPLAPFVTAEPKNRPAVFVLAPPRSGTTLLRVLLGGHPRLFAPPELELLSHDTMAERRASYTGRDSFWLEGLIRAVMEARGCDPDEAAGITETWEREGWSVRRAYRQIQEWLGGRILVDKSPSYSFDPSTLRRAEESFDGALYIHLVRHPGGMIRSFEEARLDQIFFHRPHPFSRRELAELLWLISQENIQRFLAEVPQARRHTLRFEDLVREPEPALRRLCAFLGLRFHPAMLRPYEDRSRRMTDGLRAESRMLGDVKFHTYSGIDSGVADRWRTDVAEESLGDETLRVAAELGYEVRTARSPAAIPRRHATGPAQLSFAQERLWFLAQLEPDSPFYNIPAALRLTGSLDVAALERTFAEIRLRHEGLRTVFASGPVQVVKPSAGAALPRIDLRGLPEVLREAELARLAAGEARRPFDLAAGPLLRTLLLPLDAHEHALLITMHHIVSDGWSLGVFLSELSALYGGARLPELPIQYADFAVWQRERLRGAALEEQLAWWREHLGGAPALLELPTDRPRPAVQRFRGGQVTAGFAADFAERIRSLSQRRSATSFMTLLAGFQVLLSGWSGQDDVSVGSPVAGRLWPETEPLIGFFVNTLVFRTQLERSLSFDEFLAKVQRGTIAAFAHQEIPFEKIVEELQPERSLAHSPLFQVLFAFQNNPRRTIDLPGLEISAIQSGGGTAKFDLSLSLAERDGRVLGGIEYDADLFDAATAARLLGSLETLLSAAAAEPERRISDLPLLTEAELLQLLQWNRTGTLQSDAGPCLHESFEAQADRSPEHEALVCGSERITYRELDRRANRLARRLRRLGVAPEIRVGVALERSVDLVVALLAVLKAGGAYVPLDPAYPRERLTLILEDAPVLLTQERLLDHLPPFSGRVLCMDRDRRDIESESMSRPRVQVSSRNLAYLIYTSGSTGRPKGVAIEHRSAAALLAWAEREFEDLSGVLASTSITFDLSVFELFLPLARGGRVILADNALALPDLPARNEVRLINTVPSAIAELVRLGAVPESVRTVNLAGEPLKRALAERIYALPHVERVCNLYGPSEDTTYSTWTEIVCGSDREPTIGVPIAGTRAWVMDRDLRPLPIGVPGELCLAGEGLARGYLNRPDLTAASFVPDPFGEAGERLYRTGDLARWNPGGELEFLGRIDHQVKVRGFRIELGEIETALLAHSAVRAAVVLALGEGSERRLAAYVVGEAAPTDLRIWLEGRLPAYMIPSSFAVLEVLPLTPNGKVDRKALARTEVKTEPAAAGTQTAVQELLAGIWSEVLKHGPVGPDDRFFDLGGHSLLATQVVSRVREVFGVELPLRALFEAPSLAGLAARIEALRGKGLGLEAPPVVPVPRGGRLQASFAQERLWFLDRLGTDRASYNLPAAIHLRGSLNVPALAGALAAIVRRHETLRTTFEVAGSGVVQVLGVAAPLALPVIDLRGLAERREELVRLARNDARRPFDLSHGPLLRAALLFTGADEHTLLLTQHHIVSDGWSIGVLLRELTALYAAGIEGRPSPLAPLPVQYADFAAWQRSWLQGEVLERQLGWWREHLAGAPVVLELPADRPRPPVLSFRGGRFPVVLAAELRDEAQALARRQGATPFMVLLSAFQTLLGRVANQDDVPVGTPIAGRSRGEVEGLIGFFINTLVLRARLAGDPGFGELLAQTREALLGAYAHQDLPFEKLVEELQLERSLAHSPLFQAMFILQNAPMEDLELPGVEASAVVPDTGSTKFDLRLSLTEAREGLVGSVLYSLDLFDATTVLRLARQFEALLSAALADPGARLSELPLFGAADAQQLVREWNDSREDWDLDRPLHRWIEYQVRRTPDAPALTYESETITYRELDARAGRLAGRLRRLGVGPERRVGISSERSLELVVGLLGILKAGGAYVPLDPSYPQERLAFMIEDADPVLLTRDLLVETEESATSATVDVLPDHPAYVIYTSGSTGRPKGAINSHRAIVNRLIWMQEQYGLTSEDAVLQKTPYSFDVSVWEFFWPLMVGARLVVARPGGHQDSAYLADLIRRERVTTLHFVPSMLQVFLEQPGVETCASIRRVICSGEALPYELQQRFFAKLGSFAELHNLYGPTEAAVDVSFWACEPGSARPVVPIGRPISNLRIHVLDRGSSPIPIGAPGELHIGGAGLARGYLNRPDMTAERFVPDPLGEPGSRLYRTGDLVRLLPAGEVEYLGRIDFQVKIRGFRIELGEIEAALAAHPSVKEAVVLAREDGPGDKRLVAYLTGAEPNVAELRRHLSASLPEYMIPSAFVVLPALPLSPNGKVDRKALPAPETAAPADQIYVAPRTALESYLAERWQVSLRLERVGIHDDFFALGGNSITGAILINQLQEKLGEIVHVVVIFDAPTVERMAAYLIANHARAVERIWGRESLGDAVAAGRSEVIDDAKVAQIRSLIRPLPRRAATEPKNAPAVFVLAPPRSGTTLLRVLLGGHPRLFGPPELELLSHNDMAERRAAYSGRDSFWLEGLLRAVMEARGCDPEEAARITGIWEQEAWSIRRTYAQLQEWLGERILVEKTPSYAFDSSVLRRAEEDFDGALYIHLVRHPGAVIRSFEEAKLEQIFFRREHPFSRQELAELLWLISHENILSFLAGVPDGRRHTVHFEELVREPEPVLRRLCTFLGIDLDPAMLRPYEERSRRMTDGLRAESRMLGDVKFHSHAGIDAGVAERWREEIAEDSLGEPTLRLAAALGYVKAPVSSSIPRRPRLAGEPPAPVPLSFAQERLWFLGQFDPDSSFYNITTPLGLHGDLDVAALDRGLAEIRRRHAVLRSVFKATTRGTVQIAGSLPKVGLPVVDLAGLPEVRIHPEARRAVGEEGRRPFDLETGPMLRTPLLRLSPREHILTVTMHHIASDGWSLGLLISEMAALYSNAPLTEPPIDYADFAMWQRERLSGDELERQVSWWRQELTGAPALIQLPTDRPRPAIQRFRGSRVDMALPADLSAELAALAKRQGVTVFMTLLAGFQALLSRVSGQDEIVIGAPVAGRNWPETEALIGLFVNTLVVRGHLHGDPGFAELLARTRRSVLGSFAHQEVPFEKLVEELQPERSLTHSPIFQVMFALQNIPRRRIELPGLEITAYRPEGGTAKFDLNLLLAEQDGRFAGTLEYNSDLFDATTGARLLRTFETLLHGLLSDPERRLSEVALTPETERHQMLREWNDTAAPFPDDLCLHEAFEAQSSAKPQATAVLFQGRSLTYAELDQRANRLAHRLRSLGVGPGRLVAVHLERSPEMLVAVLGIHKAGGAYVPIEVSWPADRVSYILESEGIAHIVTESARLDALPSLPHVIALDVAADLGRMPDRALASTTGPEDLAYIIFTSGSTGRPKGVMVRHRPAMNLIHWVNQRFAVGPSDALLFVTALSFDLSVYDIFGILAAGGTVRIATAEELRDPAALVRILLKEPITFWDSAPAALQQLVSWLPAEPQPAALRLVFNSGDWIPLTLPDRVRQTFPQAEFVSLGGATEATVWSNVFPVTKVHPGWVSIPYGRPIENARYHVLDQGLAVSPIGVPGDLYIAGPCLSDGYAGSPELTAQKYVPDPFGEEPGARLYRTGDRTRYGPDGNLEFLGRIDTQVKVRGFRIELGEIESVLAAHPAIREAVVLAREDSPGDQRLVAYFIAEGDPPASLELRRFVHAKLPDYMVPSVFVPLASWPLAATGKLDRKALPPPEQAQAKPAVQAPVLPRNAMEATIAEIWKDVVGLAEVGVRDNFFDVGGHSLLMARVHHRLEETLGREVSMVDLFQYPTIASLAAHLAPAAEEPTSTLRAATAPRVIERRSEDVAVIGMAGRFPGAASVEELWRNLRDEVESIRTFTDEELRAVGFGDEILDSRFVKRRGALDGPDLFDAAFFDYVPREAQIIDPQQRLFLECAWEALENAGYGAEAWRQRVGVFAGASENTYVLNLLLNSDLLRAMGRQQISIANNHDYLPTRVSYKLNLRGPSVNVQTACSTSLVAVHLARLSLLRGECEIALAGGVSVKPFEVSGYLYREGGINSPDGRTRAFDASAQGVVGGSGAGIVVLKRLEDALADGDTVLAVVRGSAINNDGSGKAGFTAPSVEGQAAAIREAHRAAGIEPETITYVEAHGTATPLGDPIEATALIQAFGETQEAGFCALGSIKTNIGHLDAGAGVAGLIKTVLSLQNRTIPASLHFERPNPKIPFEGSPFFVNARTREWTSNGLPRRAGVSSFGIGGTNAHAVLEEAPEIPPGEPSLRSSRLLVLSAKTATALEAATVNLSSWLASHPEASLDDVAFTLQVGRQPFQHRRAVVCGERADAVAALRDPAAAISGSVPSGDPSLVFLFPGQGAQYARMGAELYEREPVYRSALDRCCELLAPELGLDLRELLHPGRGQGKEADRRLAQTALTQPALFAVEYSLARLWASWGLRPAAMLGHSVGEYVAACLAGVFTLEDALSLIAARGRLMQDLPGGSMLGVSLPEEEIRAAIEGRDFSLAAINAPKACVVSGPIEEIDSLREELEARGVETRPLHTSHAFHSRSMDPILAPFAERVRQVNLQAPRLRFLSNVTGTWITAEQATDPEYWSSHLRQAVRFADGVTELMRLPSPVLLEVGPGHALSTLARQHPERKAARLVVSSLSHAKNRKPDVETVLGALGRLWVAGADVDWAGFWAAERRRRIPLPTYPFERRRFWVETNTKLPVRAGNVAASVEAPVTEEQAAPQMPAGKVAPRNPVEETIVAIWGELLGVDGIGIHDDFFELGGSSLMAVQLGSRLRQALEVELPVDFLFQASTVAGVAEMVSRMRPGDDGRPAERPRSSCLVPLQKGDGRRPLFMVHQVGGNVYTFRLLAQSIGKDLPLYGLRSRGLEDGEEPFTCVEDMAEHYLELVRNVQPAGPYRIGGASFGGMVAFEMAHRLRSVGETVELLTLMDTPCGEQMPPRRLTKEDLVIDAFRDRVELTSEELLPLSAEEQISYAFEKARKAGTLPDDFDEGANRRRVRVVQSNVAALYAYRPHPYPGRMLFFRAEQRRAGDPPRPEIAWIDLARGGCDVLLVPGNHETMHETPHVLTMAERLRGHLAIA